MRLRESARALVLDPEDHVLLVRFHWEGLEFPEGFWANPGGGVEAGESRLEALQRELREEAGLHIQELGPEVFTKTAHFPTTEWDGQVDHVYLVRTERFEPAPDMSSAELAAENVHEIRWFAPEELADPTLVFSPRCLPDVLAKLREDDIPAAPIELTGF